jgi:hypothetical protein
MPVMRESFQFAITRKGREISICIRQINQVDFAVVEPLSLASSADAKSRGFCLMRTADRADGLIQVSKAFPL